MFKPLIRAGLICLMLVIASEPQAAADVMAHKDLIIMGGSTKGLRNTNKQDIEITLNSILEDFLKNSDVKLSIIVYPSTEELYAAFDKGEIDGIFGTAVEYFAREDRFGEDTMALGFKDSVVKQRFVLVVRKADGLSKLKDLRNKRLTLANYQDTESVFLNTLLLKNQLPEEPVFFSERLDAKNPNIALMDVFFSKTDATIVRESELLTAIELNPQLGEKLYILEKSPPYVPAMGSVRKDLPRDKVNALMAALKKVYSSGRGRKLLSASQAMSLESITLEDKQSVRDLLMEYQSLKKMNSQGTTVPVVTPKARLTRNAQ
jgi:ABC-type phosphate/phosphonate transport system substrate-binding protein